MNDKNSIIMGPESSINQPLECIILAGGLGTRLRSAVPDMPKCMAPVAGHPFLKHVIDYLLSEGVTKFIFSLGYMHEAIESFLETSYPNLQYQIALESEPLGTGGAIHLACKKATERNVLILNGDTMFKANLNSMMNFHLQHQAACTLALKPMNDFDRYGVVDINHENYIQSFKEKQHYENGLINGGIYVLHVDTFLSLPFAEKFSFEKDYLEKYFNSQKMMGIVQDRYFIDIGIPEDFERASIELKI